MNRYAFGAVALLAGLVCGCRRPPEPPAEAEPPAVPPAVQLVPDPPPPRPLQPPRPRWNYELLRSVFFLRSVKPPDDSALATKQSVESYGLTTDDLTRMTSLPGVAELIPVREIPSEVKYRDRLATVTVTATTAGYADVYSMKSSAGRFLTAADNDNAEKVCALKPWVAAELFASENPLGKSVTVRGHVFTVVGVLVRDTGKEDPGLYIPYRTSRAAFGEVLAIQRDGKSVNVKVDLFEIIVRTTDPDRRGEVVNAVRDLLEPRHPKKDWDLTYPPDRPVQDDPP